MVNHHAMLSKSQKGQANYNLNRYSSFIDAWRWSGSGYQEIWPRGNIFWSGGKFQTYNQVSARNRVIYFRTEINRDTSFGKHLPQNPKGDEVKCEQTAGRYIGNTIYRKVWAKPNYSADWEGACIDQKTDRFYSMKKVFLRKPTDLKQGNLELLAVWTERWGWCRL